MRISLPRTFACSRQYLPGTSINSDSSSLVASLFPLKPAIAPKLQRPAVLRYRSHNIVGNACGNFCIDLQGDLHVCPHQPNEMRNNLVRNLTGVTPDPCRIKYHRAVVALWTGWFCRNWWINRRLCPTNWRLRSTARASPNLSRWRCLCIDLLASHLWLYQEPGIVCCNGKLATVLKATVPLVRFVVALGVGKGILFPRQHCQPRLDGAYQNRGALQAWQIKVPAEVIHKLLDRDGIPPP